MDAFWLSHKISIDIFLFVIFLISLSNLIALKKLKYGQLFGRRPRVSICIPVRDEKDNIMPCLKSLLAQKYPNFEIIILHDDGDSEMEEILSELTIKDNRLKVIKGKSKPDDWVGKHWACHQMSKIADGELLLFTDADTRHHPKTLNNAVAALIKYKSDFLSVIPKETVHSFGEKITVPIMSWSIHTFFPIGIAQKFKSPRLSISVGQFMLIKADSYAKIGGHEAIKDEVADDIMLGRKILEHGLNWRLIDGSNYIKCRMYHSFSEAYEGFSRSLLPGFQYNYPSFIFVWHWVLLIFYEPLIFLFYHYAIEPLPDLVFYLTLYEIAISLVLFGLVCVRFKFPLYLMFLYPIIVIMAWIISLNSLYIHTRGKVKWKGRIIRKKRKKVNNKELKEYYDITIQKNQEKQIKLLKSKKLTSWKFAANFFV